MKKIILILGIILASTLAADEVLLDVPSDSSAKYFILDKEGTGNERIIVTKRIGKSGESYSRRLFYCDDNTTKYLGDGGTIDEMNNSKEDTNMANIVEGSIAYFIGVEACN